MTRRCASALAALLLVGAVLSCSAPPPRSVLLIVVDTLRADHLGLYGYGRDTSPELDALAKDAAVYEYAFAPSPWTLPSFGSLFTGRLPAEHLAGWPAAEGGGKEAERNFLPLREDARTLAETLASHGRETAAVMSNAFLNADFGVARGFQTYDHVAGNRKRIRPADEVVDQALDWLGAEDRDDFFLVVHFFDPHLNYDAPDGFRGRFSTELPEAERSRMMELRPLRQRIRKGEEIDWDFLIGAYDEEIAFVDQQIGRLWRGLEASGRLDETLVVLTADHGEEFNDHGGFEHGHTLYNELLRIPLVIWGPGVEAGRRPEPVSLIDLFPTVLEMLELPAEDGLPGRSLARNLTGDRAPIEERTLIAERTLYGAPRESALAWPYKLVYEPRRKRVSLFNLEEDFGETQDISRLRRGIARELRVRLDAYRELTKGNAGEAAELDEETLEALRSLGYIR